MNSKILELDNLYLTQCRKIKELIELSTGVEDIGHKTRKEAYTHLRKIYSKLCRTFTNAPYETIGKVLGDYDHATILTQVRTFEDLYETNGILFREVYDKITRHLKADVSFSTINPDLRMKDKFNALRINFFKLVEKYRNIIRKRDKTIEELKAENIRLNEKIIEYGII